jgi:peptidoglycan/xylan/chitin deacetylase (PgdA/CDA1 family)
VTFSWPHQARFAVCFSFDLDGEEAWLAMDPANVDRPVVLSQGAYGPRVAVWLLLDILARHGAPATFFVPGRIAERYPAVVRAVLAAGHEVAHHGYRHVAPASLSAEDEVHELRRGRDALEALGATVTGYRAPDWELAPDSLERIAAEGFSYSSNFMDDITAYRHPGLSLVELPVHWVLDDAAHFWFSNADWSRKMATNEEVGSIWGAEEAGIAGLGGVCMYTFHPQVIGRPGRLALFESLVLRAVSNPAAWVATATDVAAHAAVALPASGP